jgi:hypothetical protein
MINFLTKFLNKINFGNLFFAFASIFTGYGIFVTKEIPGLSLYYKVYAYIGYYGYILGLIFVLLGLYILYYEYKKINSLKNK